MSQGDLEQTEDLGEPTSSRAWDAEFRFLFGTLRELRKFAPKARKRLISYLGDRCEDEESEAKS